MKKLFAVIFLFPVFAMILSVTSISASEPYVSKDNGQHMQIVEYNPENFERAWVYSIAVSRNESIAIGFNNDIILITDKNFNVKCAIKVEYIHVDDSPIFELNWDENENLQISSRKTDTVFVVDIKGNLLDDYQTEDFYGNKGVCTVNGNTYGKRASNFLMIIAQNGACDEIFKVDAAGNETVLFKSEKNAPYKILAILTIFVGGHIFLVIGVCSVYIKKYGKKSIFKRKDFKYKGSVKSVYKFRYGTRPLLVSLLSIPFAIVVILITNQFFEFELHFMFFTTGLAIIIAIIKSVMYFETYKIDGKLIYRRKLKKAKPICIPDNAVFLVVSALETNNQITDNSLIVHVIDGDVHNVVKKLHEEPEPPGFFIMFKRMLRLDVFDDYYIKNKYQDAWIYSFKYIEEITPTVFEAQKRTVIIPRSLLYKMDVDNENYDLFIDDEQIRGRF